MFLFQQQQHPSPVTSTQRNMFFLDGAFRFDLFFHFCIFLNRISKRQYSMRCSMCSRTAGSGQSFKWEKMKCVEHLLCVKLLFSFLFFFFDFLFSLSKTHFDSFRFLTMKYILHILFKVIWNENRWKNWWSIHHSIYVVWYCKNEFDFSLFLVLYFSFCINSFRQLLGKTANWLETIIFSIKKTMIYDDDAALRYFSICLFK